MFRVSQNKIIALADVSRDIGQIFFAAVVIEPIISGQTGFVIFISGTILSIIFFGLGIILPDIAIHY